MITKREEKDESLRKAQDNQSTKVQAQTVVPSNPNSEAVIKPLNKKRMSTQTERHQERKKQKLQLKREEGKERQQ